MSCNLRFATEKLGIRGVRNFLNVSFSLAKPSLTIIDINGFGVSGLLEKKIKRRTKNIGKHLKIEGKG